VLLLFNRFIFDADDFERFVPAGLEKSVGIISGAFLKDPNFRDSGPSRVSRSAVQLVAATRRLVIAVESSSAAGSLA
jgi:hypothetical protein